MIKEKHISTAESHNPYYWKEFRYKNDHMNFQNHQTIIKK